MQQGLNRRQQATEATDLPRVVDRRTGLLTALRVQAFSGGTEHVDCSKSGNMDTLEYGCFQRVTGL